MNSTLLQHVIDEVVARLQRRAGQTRTLSAAQFQDIDCRALSSQHEALNLTQVSLPQLRQLAKHQEEDRTVRKLFEVLSLGLQVRITIPGNLLPAIPVHKLSGLPLKWCDEHERAIVLHPTKLLSYADVASLNESWLVLRRHCVITALALDAARARNIHLIKQE
ncbi:MULTISPECIES: microcompartment protein PduM [Enterobacterales]|uniref:microcompartment protein PduM n=1 Tax=Enterobacterales TaxID=91347 RepID=UPI002EDB01A4